MIPDWAAKATAVPYGDFSSPQSLNLYSYIENNPLAKADPDGHCDWCSDAIDFSFGVVRGAASSISFGAAGSPQSTDTNASRLGQIVGSGLVGASGEITSDAGKGAVAVGLAGELPSAGTSTSLVVVGAGATAVGTVAEAGAAANLAKIVTTPMQSSGQGPKAANAAGVTAGGQATDKYGNKLGPSGKPQVNETNSNTREGARNRALNEGSGVEEHSNPQQGDPHFHPTDNEGNKKPSSTHHNYDD